MQNNTPQPRWISFFSISIGGRNMTLCFSTRVGRWRIARHWWILFQISPHKSILWQPEWLWPPTSHSTSHTHTSHFIPVTKLCVLFILSAGRLAGGWVCPVITSRAGTIPSSPVTRPATLLSIYITYLMLSTWPKVDVMTVRWWRQLWALMELSGGDLALNTAPVGMPATADKALLLFWLDVLRSDISNAGLVMAQGYQNMHCDYILNTIISWSPPRSRSFDLVLELEQDVKDALCSSPSWISSW